MTEKRCEDEAEANIRLNTLSKFILDKLARAFRESGFDGSALDARPRADETDLPPFLFQSCAVYRALVTPLQQEIKDGDFQAVEFAYEVEGDEESLKRKARVARVKKGGTDGHDDQLVEHGVRPIAAQEPIV
ncbi:hypothetical protein ABG067_006537 [Albugo candida]